jgi:hypothetical protein
MRRTPNIIMLFAWAINILLVLLAVLIILWALVIRNHH